MSKTPFLLPAPLARVLSTLPAWPGSAVFAQGLDCLLAPRLPDDVKQALQGRRICVRVTDAGLAFQFTWNGRNFRPLADARGQALDLSLAASLADYVLMLRREEDPDTLFFSRRLVIEGDTELGLLVKNTLDTVELPRLPLPPFIKRRAPPAQ